MRDIYQLLCGNPFLQVATRAGVASDVADPIDSKDQDQEQDESGNPAARTSMGGSGHITRIPSRLSSPSIEEKEIWKHEPVDRPDAGKARGSVFEVSDAR